MIRHLMMVAALIAAGSLSLSCKVNEYCIGCDPTGDGGTGDGGGDDDGGTGDGSDGGGCTNTGPEVCDNKDNDCDGHTDEGTLPEVGQLCSNQTGECMGGVKQCVSGAIVCSKQPIAELCDTKDNNCNGMTDEGDPGGGAKCGTDTGECVAGTFHCIGGSVQCIGFIDHTGDPEQCNGRDDDCDNQFDEGLTNIGTCGVANVGECQFGTLMCLGGGTVCVGSVGPTFELCDNLDQDCDGNPTNGFDLVTDPLNCGMCGNVCNLPNAFEGCAGGNCTVAACQPSFHNNNGLPGDGCEYGPCTIQGGEACNGVDDNCNGSIDEGVTPPAGLCLSAGECAAGTTVTCDGVSGFRCHYSDPDVSQDAMGNITPETLCDGKDNDCDGNIDEGQPNKGQVCDNGLAGDCRSTGTFQCNAAMPNGPASCVITTPGPGNTAEICDGRDNDCDGTVDNGAGTGNMTGQSWITIPGVTPAVQIMKYEASRPNATASNGGTLQTHTCSRQGVQPWTNVTYPQAVLACQAVGARLCTETEWQTMCAQPVAPVYPMAGPTGTADFVFIEAEQASANVSGTSAGTTRTFTNDTTSNFSGVRALIATPNTGGNVTAANAPLQSPRLDFQVNFQQTGNHFVWVRLYSENGNDNAVWTGINTTAGSAAVNTQLAPGVAQTWSWVVSPAFNIPATGNRFVSVFMRRDGVRVDAIAISKDGTNLPPMDEKIWAFQNNPKLPQPQICNGDEFDTVPGGTDQDDVLATGTLPGCFANGSNGGVFDLSGNAKEWTIARASQQNPIRGGASNNEVNGLTCQLNFTLADDTFFFPNVGFRCCR